MTEKASPKGYNPDRAEASRDEPGMELDLTRFFRDWSELWREEMQARSGEPEGLPLGMLAGMAKGGMTADMTAAMEMWRAAMVAWANLSGAGLSGSGMPPSGKPPSGMPATGTPPSGMSRSGGSRSATAGTAGSMAAQTPRERPSAAASGDHTIAPRTKAASAAFDPRDAEIERLARRVDELEARLAKLDVPRPAKSRMEKSRGHRG